MAATGRPTIDDTGAKIKPQGMGGYIPHVRSKRGEMGEYTHWHADDPYSNGPGVDSCCDCEDD
jgi:hypothetical protein